MGEIVPQKLCARCQQIKSVDQFTLKNKKKNRYQSYCKDCSAAYARTRYAQSSNVPVEGSYKRCSKCKRLLPATSEFYFMDKVNKSGVSSQCKVCIGEYYQENKDRILEYHVQYRQDHKDEIAKKKSLYHRKNKDTISAKNRRYRQEHKDTLAEKKRRYHQEHRDQLLVYKSQYYQKNKSHLSALQKQYYREHRDTLRIIRALYYQSHKDKLYQQNRQRAQNHRERYREYNKKYVRIDRGKLVHRANVHKRRAIKKLSGGSYTAQQLLDQMKRQRSLCYYCSAKLGDVYHADHIVPLSRGGSNDISNIVITCPTCNLRKSDKLPHEWPEGGRLL